MKRFSHIGCFGCLTWLLIAGSPLPSQAVPPDADDLTLQSMCREGLTASAIIYATAQQQLAEKNDEQYARWTQRLIECEAQAALRSATEAEQHWSRCAELHTAFVEARPKSRRLPWLNWQVLRGKLLRAQNHLAQWLAAPAAVQHREQALELIREIVSGLDELESDLKIRQPLAAKLKPNDPTQAPAEQIAQLRLEGVLLRCEAFLARSRLYESGSRDRVGAATEVEEQATSVLDRAGEEWSSRASLEVARAAAWLELGRASEGVAQLQLLAQSAAEPTIRTRAAVIAVEWLVANQQLSQAHVFAGLLKKFDAGAEAELADLRLQLAELADLPIDKKDAALSKLLGQSQSIGTRYGDYWRSRADSILVGTLPKESTQQTSTAMELVAVEVRQLLAAGNVQAAITKLVATSRNELAANHGESAIRAASQAAALLHRQKDWLPAADVLQTTTLKVAAIPVAADAHLLAIWSVSQALRSSAKDVQLQTRYEAMLREHLELWPKANTAEKVLIWLREWLAALNRRSQLLPIYRQAAEQSPTPELARSALLGWLDEALLCKSSERADEIESLKRAIAEGRLKLVESTAHSVVLCATLWPTWTEPQAASAWFQETRQLATRANEPIDRSLTNSTLLLLAARELSDAQASEHAQKLDLTDLSTIALGSFLQACVTALDARPQDIADQDVKGRTPNSGPTSGEPAWTAKLVVSEDRLADLAKHVDARLRVAAFRWQIAVGVATAENLDSLRKVCSEHSADPYLQMQLAEALAQLRTENLAESTSIAKQVAASSPKNSELHLSARWRLLRNQQLAGELVQAQRAAKLLLATQSFESELWKNRFARIAGND